MKRKKNVGERERKHCENHVRVVLFSETCKFIRHIRPVRGLCRVSGDSPQFGHKVGQKHWQEVVKECIKL